MADVVVCPHCRRLNAPVAHTCECGERISDIPAVPRSSVAADGSVQPRAVDDSGLSAWGWAMFSFGVIGMLISFALPSSTRTGADFAGGISEVHNIGMLARNLGVLLMCGFLAVCGLLMVVAGKVTR